MKITPIAAISAVALLSLSACQNEPEEVTSVAPDPNREALANKAPVVLPPSMTDSVTFRCRDNSLVYVEFFSGNTQVNLRTARDGSPTVLRAPAAGEPYVAEGGYSLSGTPQSITVSVAGAAPKTCHA